MTYTFGKPPADPIQTIVGTKSETEMYVPVKASIKLLLRVHDPSDVEHIESGVWEPEVREWVATLIVRGVVAGFTIDTVAVTELEMSI